MKKNIWQMLALLFTVTALTIFSSFPAHAATKIGGGGNVVTHPSSTVYCVKATESDTGFGITFTSLGSRLNLNNVYFGASNNCARDTTNGFWRIVISTIVCDGKIQVNRTPASGSFGKLSAGNFEHFVSGTLLIECDVYTNGKLTGMYPPSHATVSFGVNANFGGGTGSSDSVIKNYN